jgi:hypothetical protein
MVDSPPLQATGSQKHRPPEAGPRVPIPITVARLVEPGKPMPRVLTRPAMICSATPRIPAFATYVDACEQSRCDADQLPGGLLRGVPAT